MMLPALITLPYRIERDPPPFEDNYIKSPESLARQLIGTFTKKGGKVFDPFAGLGTTLFVAEEMGRDPYGIEAEDSRYEWVAGQLENWMQIVHGDSGDVAKFGFPKMDFCFAAPPYMQAGHRWNPLYAGNPKQAGYDKYLKRMGIIYREIARVMKKGAYVAVQADNLPGRPYTPLVRDLSLVISKSLKPVGETIVIWETPKADYPATTCLIFKNQ